MTQSLTPSQATRGLYSASFLNATERRDLLLERRLSDDRPATSLKDGSHAIVPAARHVGRLSVSTAWVTLIHERLVECIPRLSTHFGESIEGRQEPQFLRYVAGNFHKAHRDRGLDGSGPDWVRWQTVSVVIFVNPGEYQGGLLAFHELGTPGSGLRVRGRPGGIVGFSSSTLHEVEPIVRGERYTIAAWYEGAKD